MRKHLLSLGLIFLLLFVFLMLINMPSIALAAGAENLAPREARPGRLPAKSAYLADYDTATVIFEQNANDKLPIASMSKIMTALLVLEAIDGGKLDPESLVTVSAEAAGMGGSQVFLDANSRHKVKDLLKAVIVCSANDASVALAETVSGSEMVFVDMMNKRAKELGMKNTHFSNCTGLPAPENFSCAKDVFIMTRELIKHKMYFDFSKIWLEDYAHPDGRKTTITNTNKLVRFYNGCDGGKTGFTSEALYCLSATAKRGNLRVIAVIIGVDNSKTRFAEVSKMLNFAFANYENKTLLAAGEAMENSVEVVRGKCDAAKVGAQRNICAFMKRGDEAKWELKAELPKTVKAPLCKGDVVGKIYVLKNSVVVDEVPAVLLEDVPKATYLDDIKRIIREW
jgi:D-alanyl-D-alanine carboxypeptidase (penicillin-binding protein 5/6)